MPDHIVFPENSFWSVGIDIGTSTTKIVLSRLSMTNRAPSGFTPDVILQHKEVVYRSPIYRTPLLAENRINFSALKEILATAYRSFGINAHEIQTGAVIITGESARKENSAEVLHNLAQYAGDFVVSIAGPDLEAILAGYGSGAEHWARTEQKRIININIGGGTTNIVIFEGAHVVDAFALDIGGKLIQFDSDHNISYISPRIKPLLQHYGISCRIDQKFEPDLFHQISDKLVSHLAELFLQKTPGPLTAQLCLSHLPHDASLPLRADKIFFSGGVAEMIYPYITASPADFSPDHFERAIRMANQYHDLGGFLARSIALFIHQQRPNAVSEPPEKIYATVIGAGNHTMNLSGSTVFLEGVDLPLKNIPVIPLFPDNDADYAHIRDILIRLYSLYGVTLCAFSFIGPISPSYPLISDIADQFVDFIDKFLPIEIPVIILVEHDFARALGQLIQNHLRIPHPLVVLDRIKIQFGTYIDIGKPLLGVVPVVCKTIIFNSGTNTTITQRDS
jgi:ethanolamine utilization protein EutA